MVPVFVLAACGSSNPATTMPTTDVPPADASADVTDASVDSGGDVGGDVGTDAGAPRVTQIEGGSFAHSCAALSTGAVRCWGVNDNGQLGVSPAESRQRCRVPDSSPAQTLPCEHTPRDVPSLTNVASVAVGNGGTCALKTDGSVWCWGVNDVGELGQGTHDTSPHPTPARVDLPAVRQVAYGAFHVCALLTDGTVRCWGNNKFGQVGLAPDRSETTCDPGDGFDVGCQRRPRAVEGLSNVRQITAGRNHTCALLMDGSVRCWGLNDSGQIGNGMVESQDAPRIAPTAVTGLSNVTQVAAGGSHTCALLMDGTVRCWGWAGVGQLGGATTTNCQVGSSDTFQCANAPAAVPELTGVRHLATGRYHTCAALTAGGVRCAGRNDEYQLGTGALGTDRCSLGVESIACTRRFGDVSIPATSAVAVGNYHSCALLNDGTVRCWGAGYYGQIGDGNTTNREGPVATSNLP